MSEKKQTFTVMHDKGEWVDGKNVRPYETFSSVMTPDLAEKVKKGFLVKGSLKSTASSKKTSRKSAKKK